MKRKVIAGLFLLAGFSASAEAQWVQSLPINSPVISLSVSGTTLIAGTNGRDTIVFIDTSLARYAPTIYVTTNYGASWTAPDTAVKWGGAARCFAVDGSTVYLGNFGGITNNTSLMDATTIYSSNSFTNFTVWNPVPTSSPDFYYWIFSMAVSGSNLYIGGSGGFYRSTNSGASWTPGGAINEVSALLALSDTNLYAGTNGLGIFRSIDNGTSWTAVASGLGTYGKWITCLASSGTNVFAGTQAGVFRSSDNGTSWTKANNGLTDTNVMALAVRGSTLFAGTSTYTVDSAYEFNGFYFGAFVGGGIFRSTDNGATWRAVNTGFPAIQPTLRGPIADMDVRSLAVCGDTLFAGSYRGGVWQRPLSDMVTSVERGAMKFPLQYRLEQNYPNPFNPATTIRYSLPKRSLVRLTVFNTLGQQVASLVNGDQEAGFHEAQFNGSGLASGVYFYSIQAGGFVQTKKLLLLR